MHWRSYRRCTTTATLPPQATRLATYRTILLNLPYCDCTMHFTVSTLEHTGRGADAIPRTPATCAATRTLAARVDCCLSVRPWMNQ